MSRNKSYPGHIRRRGNSYQLILTVDSKRHRYSFRDRGEAEEFARAEFDRLRRRLNAGGLSLRMTELLDAYVESEVPKKAPRTQDGYRVSIRGIRYYFEEIEGNPRADRVRPLHIQRFVGWRSRHRFHRGRGPRAGTVSARTVAKDRTQLSMCFSWAERLEIVDRNPVSRVAPPRQDPREPIILTDDEYERLLAACDRKARPFLWLYVLVLGEAGLRCDSEALWLRWQAVDMERGFLTVEGSRKGRRTKSGRARVVPLTRRLREALRDHAARYRLCLYNGRRTDWIFHHERDRRHATAGERITRLRSSFERAAERAGLPAALHHHDLRHRRVTKWLSEGRPAHIVQKAMGHADLRTTLGYEHLVPEDLMQLVEERPRIAGIGS